jgi:hypothetical protein
MDKNNINTSGVLVNENGIILGGSHYGDNNYYLNKYKSGYAYNIDCIIDEYNTINTTSILLPYNIKISLMASIPIVSPATTIVGSKELFELVVIKEIIVKTIGRHSFYVLDTEIEPYLLRSRFIEVSQYNEPSITNAPFIVKNISVYDIPSNVILPKPSNELLINSYFNEYPDTLDKLYYYYNYSGCEIINYTNSLGDKSKGVLVNEDVSSYFIQGRLPNNFEHIGTYKIGYTYTITCIIEELIESEDKKINGQIVLHRINDELGIPPYDIRFSGIGGNSYSSSAISIKGPGTYTLSMPIDGTEKYNNGTLTNLNNIPILIRVTQISTSGIVNAPFIVSKLSLTESLIPFPTTASSTSSSTPTSSTSSSTSTSSPNTTTSSTSSSTPTSSTNITTSSMNITTPIVISGTSIDNKFVEKSYQTGIIQTSPTEVSLDYNLIFSTSTNIDDSIKLILENIGGKDINYTKEEIGDKLYIRIYKNASENFENAQNNKIKLVIFRFTPDTLYLIEPLLKYKLEKPTKSKAYLIAGITLGVIVFFIILLTVLYKMKLLPH